MASQSYLIVGGGVFGVSTAYTLIQKYPNASVTIVDRDPYDGDNRVAASWDWNKVVRADYDDLLYCRLALEAQDIFESDPLWMPHFHKAGVFWVCRSDYAQDVINNYKKLGREHDISVYTIEEAKKLYGGLYEEANYDGAKEVLVNRNSGWGAAGDSLRAVTREAMKLGVKYVVADVATLQIENGRATGIQTSKGEIISADTVILSTGAYTAKLLEYSAARHNLPDLRSGDRITAAGITTGMVTLDDESYGRMKDMPVGFQGYTYKHKSPFIGSLPPTKDREIKWWGKNIFSNTRQVLPGRYVSAPPDEKDYAQWKVPNALKEDIDTQNRLFFGSKGAHWKYEHHRICWDAFTSSGDFIISPHAGAQGLYVATCGSFHGYKFFPVLGKYVVQMLEDKLEPELKEKWAWDRERPDGAFNCEFPNSELKDLLDPAARL